MVAAVIFSNTHWTFWDFMLFVFIWIPLVMMWFFCMFDVFGRKDLGGWGKALWLLAIVFVPWIGSLAYLIFRPSDREAYAPAYTGSGPYGEGYGAAPSVASQREDRVPTVK